MNLSPFSQKNNVPIIFSANNQFVPYMSVMIASIIANASKDYCYDLIIFHRDISDENKKILRGMLSSHKNFSVRFLNVSPYVEKYTLYTENRSFFSIEAYFRLLAPFVMCAFDKAIYCDGDMVVTRDIAELMQVDLSDNLIAAVRDYCGLSDMYNPDTVRRDYMIHELKLQNPDNYYISGLLVMNLKKFRESFTADQIMQLAASRQWTYHDQDVLNILTENQTILLDPRWNVLQDYGMHHFLPGKYYQEWKDSFEDPFIIHYGGDGKPWRFPRIPKSKFFWKYAQQSPYYQTIKQRRKTEMKEAPLYRIKYYLQFLFPLGSQSRVVVKRMTKGIWEPLKRRVEKNNDSKS